MQIKQVLAGGLVFASMALAAPLVDTRGEIKAVAKDGYGIWNVEKRAGDEAGEGEVAAKGAGVWKLRHADDSGEDDNEMSALGAGIWDRRTVSGDGAEGELSTLGAGIWDR
ncbi:hypothetical protein PG990_011589 [Apiospora arundinis]